MLYCQYIKSDTVLIIFTAPLIADCQFEENLCGWKSFSREGKGGWKLSSRNLDPKGKSIHGWHRLKGAMSPVLPRQDFAVQRTFLLKFPTVNHLKADTFAGRIANLVPVEFIVHFSAIEYFHSSFLFGEQLHDS